MARKVYLRGGLGVGSMEEARGTGAVLRHILQQLQTMNIVDLDIKGGRKITSSGERDLDQVAGRIAAAV
ncbi:unnamed protein product [Brassica rapa]|uniref:Uncharacterized protein n=1 Tax=Brassica campestris TaxID=3711 RepID=A0A3P6ANJ6_BRACM|nr:unnamed protein product [Brassica rapa]VDC92957.1 unnamed protein product [Brassica rapa]